MGQAQVFLDNTSLDPDCVGQRYWYVFFISSLLTLFGGIFVIFIWRVLAYICYGKLLQRFRKAVSFFSLIHLDQLIRHNKNLYNVHVYCILYTWTLYKFFLCTMTGSDRLVKIRANI